MKRKRTIFKKRRHTRSAYRSGLEDLNADRLTNLGYSYEYEAIRIPYVKKGSTYTPDFTLPNGIIIETKGYFDSSDRTKHILISEQHPDLDIRFVFNNPKTKISKRSKTTYGDWCSKNGFLYATGEIPEAWLKEDVNMKRLAAMKKFSKG